MSVNLIVRKTIRATPAMLFEAWTTPQCLLQWWGPKGVRCSHAEIDLRVGGALRIGNLLPDGSTLWILGEFILITPSERLDYTWRTEPALTADALIEKVSVRFIAKTEEETEVIVVHERIANETIKEGHTAGWQGCLDGLEQFATASD